MEQSVAKPKRFKKPATFLVVLLALWLLPSLALLNLSRSYTNSLAQIEELGIRVNELRQSLYFSEPLRVSRINDLALDAQLVYSIRLQIESDFQHALFRPDVNQLLYVADQFLEKFDEFIPIESQVQDIVDNIKMLRADKELSPKLKPLLNEFGVVVFEAMYSDNQSSSATYRAFDSILEKSYSLETEEQDALQQLLADASALLSDYAQLNYLVDKIKKNSVNEQIIKLEAEFHDRQFNLLLVMLGLSLVAMIALVLWGANAKKLTKETGEEFTPEPEVESSKPSASRTEADLEEATSGSVPRGKDSVSHELNRSVASSAVKTADNASHVVGSQHSNFQSQPSSSVVSQPVTQQNIEDVPVAEKHVASVTDSKPAIDIEDMLETLDGDAESVELLLGVFVQDHADDYEKFKSLLTKDETSAARVVHSLKGVAGSIKASRLAIIAASIEMTMKQSRAISEHDLTELEQAIKASVDSAHAYLDNQR
ncbi:HPt (histidine-containing phosphotransfer) domain-containing protein [Vibrio crassostreae]|nr:Hpt domain-containing protein [Vibrio crassostreae]RPF16559.1 HPt (histidine-containing phosphotransfer) domain-containing protein [Vibrio crassostreae]TCN89431.1 HPt (histidine-containing phosphotransfer) domain-containing protein [Vibrio crassostreae]